MTDTTVKTAMPDSEVHALLQRALGHFQRGQTMEVEATLSHILKARPEEPDALQLMGVLRREQGRLEEAEQFYRRSLAAKRDQPQVQHNLGNLLRATGRLEEAIAAQREAIRLKANYAEAYLNLGMTLADTGDLEGAERAVRRALHIQPNFLLAKQNLGAILNELGQHREAEAVLRQAMAGGSPNPRQTAALEHNLGVAVSRQGRYAEAVQLFDSAQNKVPDMAFVDYNRGNALQGAGQLEDAANCYRRAIARNPLDIAAHRDLNHVLYRLGDDANFLRSYESVMALYPDQGALPLARANFLFAKGDFEKAREDFERAAKTLPDIVTPHDGLGLVFARLGDFDAAIKAHETALRMEPQNGPAWRNYAETLLRAGDTKKGLDAAEKAVAIDREEQGALAILSTAYRMLDDPRGESLSDYESLVQVFDLEPPEGYTDMAAFNNDLNAFVATLHRDQREVIDQTLRGGTQTLDNIFGRGHDLVERLRRRIDEAVGAYIARMKPDENHPLLRRRRKGFAYSGSWSTCLLDSGYHTNHFHPKGWISSAYYVSIPEAVEDARSRQGWLKFGEPSFDAGLKEPVQHMVQPQSGRLVLFPSYMWHGTVPFHSPNARVAVAFDAVPQ